MSVVIYPHNSTKFQNYLLAALNYKEIFPSQKDKAFLDIVNFAENCDSFPLESSFLGVKPISKERFTSLIVILAIVHTGIQKELYRNTSFSILLNVPSCFNFLLGCCFRVNDFWSFTHLKLCTRSFKVIKLILIISSI